MKFRYVPLGFFLLMGCTTLTPEQCLTANWVQIGEQDGLRGYIERTEQHRQACAKVNIQPNVMQYKEGYQTGLKVYCQPQVILEHALQGRGRYDICPAPLQSGLYPYHDAGRRFYEAQQQRDQFIAELEKYQGYLLDEKLSLEKRHEYINKVKALKVKKYTVDKKYDEAERVIERLEQRLRDNTHLYQ